MTIRVRASAAAMLTTSGDWQDTPTHVVLRVGANVWRVSALTTALRRAIENNDIMRVMNEGIPLDYTIDNATGEAALNAVIAAGLSASSTVFTLSMHKSNPGTVGAVSDSTELTAARNPGYKRLTVTLESAVI